MNKRGYGAIAFAVLLALVFGVLILSLHFGNASGGATVGGNSLLIYRCGELNENGTYVLNQSISNGTADCLIIRADGITIDGNGSTIYGNINASNGTSNAFTNLTLQNSIVNGSAYLIGGTVVGGSGQSGGYVQTINSTILEIISKGGIAGSPGGSGGNAGSISIVNSNVTRINITAGPSFGGTPGGSTGTINLINSSVFFVYSYGGYGSVGGSTGEINISNSNLSIIESRGGIAGALAGGSVGAIRITSSNISRGIVLIAETGGLSGAGGSAGPISIYSSFVSSFNVTGGASGSLGGDGGSVKSIQINDSVLGFINVTAGLFKGSDSGYVNGSGSAITLLNSSFIQIYNPAGNITRQWWLDLNATTTKNVEIANVNISIYNKSVKLINNQLTDSNGRIVRQVLTEYFYNGTSYVYFSNYTINSTKIGFANASTSINMSTNKNIVFNLADVLAPSVSLTSPLTGTSYTGEPVDVQFAWDASDSGVGIANCTIWVKGNPYHNVSAITATNNNRTLSLGPTSYVANVSCTDYDGNVGNSSVISFTISAPAASSTSVGGGAISYSSSLSQDSSVTKSLAYGDQIRFSYSGSAGSESHTLTLDSTNGDSATFTIRSDPITLTMKVNETRKIDLNKDGIYDILVVLNKIVRGRVDVTIKKINEAIEGKESVPIEVDNQGIQNVTIVPEDKGMDVNKILESVLVVFVIALLIIAVVLARNLKFKKKAGAIRIKSYKGR